MVVMMADGEMQELGIETPQAETGTENTSNQSDTGLNLFVSDSESSGDTGQGQENITPASSDQTFPPAKSSIIKDGSRQHRQRKKTVSFSSMPSDRKISSTAACISVMLEGCAMKKVRSNSRVYNRYFLLDSDLRALRWEPTKKDSDKAKIDIKSIKEVRLGKKTPVLRGNGVSEQFAEECAFSVIYGENYDSLDLVAGSADTVNIWVMGLRYLASYGKHTPEQTMGRTEQASLRSSWLETVFRRAVGDGDGDGAGDGGKADSVPLARAVELVQGLSGGTRAAKIELKFKELLKSKDRAGGPVTLADFTETYCELCTRPEIYFLMVQFSSHKEHLDCRDLMLFVETEQGLGGGCLEQTCLELIRKYEPSEEGRERGLLGVDGFTNYLLSPDCHVFDPQHDRVCQDMGQPLSHYFINCSSSSGLWEDLSEDPSSDVAGRCASALRSGCRGLELAVRDGPADQPLVYCPGRPSLPGRSAFGEVLDAVNRHAFVASDYPLILSLVTRCSAAQQRVMARQLKDTLGERLYTERPSPERRYLPSPDELRGRILLTVHQLPDDRPESEADAGGAEVGRRMMTTSKSKSTPTTPTTTRVRKERKEKESPEGGPHLCRELSDLVSLCRSVPFVDFESSKRDQSCWETCSFDEALAGRLADESPGEWLDYSKRFLSGVSPSLAGSGHLPPTNPQRYWRCGCQMVWAGGRRGPGRPVGDLEAGWFRQNGNCGYVLRPAASRAEFSYFHASTGVGLPCPARLLRVRVISGQHLPKPRGSAAKGDVVEPYVRVELRGAPADCSARRTRTDSRGGDCPVFDESFEFLVGLPELAVLSFVALDDDYIGDEFIGQNSVPVVCLRSGYRHVPLRPAAAAAGGPALPHATLFVHLAVAGRGPSVRKGRRAREYTATRVLGIRAVDEVCRAAAQPLREAADLRENVQNAMVSFKELCGLTPVANMKQCVLTLSSWLMNSDNGVSVMVDLSEQYPSMEAQGPVPELLKKVLAAYDTMVQTSKMLIESADRVFTKLMQVQRAGLEFHQDLHRMGAEEGLKGRKLQKAFESFAWNITVLKGQADLLKQAKNEALDNLRQIHCTAQTCGLSKNGSSSPSPDLYRQQPALCNIPESETASDTGSC